MIVENIKVLCARNNTSFAEVERRCGLGNGVIRRWDESSPRLESIKRVADYFGVTVDELTKEG